MTRKRIKGAKETNYISKFMEQNPELLKFIVETSPYTNGVLHDAPTSPSHFNKTPIKFLDKDEERYMRGISRTIKDRLMLESHLLAINFLSYHLGKEHICESMLSNLQTLLATQFKRGLKAAKKESAKTKKRR